MMKTTYLIYKQVNGIRQLAEATPEEWDAKIGRQIRISKASFDEWLDGVSPTPRDF